ncbi:MAG: Asp-tRNA(Asn)/Glu-tRNA(Gln) amidotransferase subunit GatA [Deltaproteobacteria bacterium]|nr:Asp-tRNA(Asn)/Glu-tRNA(Gln) amidotransferase subunit GatA [Deltaproteobacteria bacterium]
MECLLDASLSFVADRLAAREVSSVELIRACLDRIDATPTLNTFITIDEDGARRGALAADDRRAHGRALSRIDGVPIALKDLLMTAGLRTTAASKMLANYVPPYDGAMAERLRAQGAIMLGKTNCDEFAMGSSNEHSAFGPVRNPWDETRVAGGSSGGSAAAVAAGQVFAALGTDTGGSIRQPAALTGVVGLKPTYGRVSRFGVIAFASSLDQVGPFGRTAKDVAHVMQAIAGFDERDSTSADVPVPDYLSEIDGGIEGLKVGVPTEYFGEGLDPDVETLVRQGIETLGHAGAEIVPISLPHTRYALSTYYVICTAEASSNLARYDGVRYGHRASSEHELRRMYAASRSEGFGDEVKRRIVLGTYVLSSGYYDAYYAQAQKVRTLIRRDFESAFKHVDVIATPTSPSTAFRLGDKTTDPLSMYMADVCTLAVNLAGIPGLSTPAGLAADGLPVGLQLLGPWFEEGRLLRVAHAFEQATGHADRRPTIKA